MENNDMQQWRRTIIDAALSAADPIKAVKNGFVAGLSPSIADLKDMGYRQFHAISIGKAAIPMIEGLLDACGEAIGGGVIVPKRTYSITPKPWHDRILISPASHPVPDQASMDAAKSVLTYLDKLQQNDFVYFLISGGGSALITLPEGNISLNDMAIMSQLLLACGATIDEINTIRKHIDRVKGGKLIKHTSPAGFGTLVLSDVLGDPLDVIASGPTVFDPTTFQDAWSILNKYELLASTPQSIKTLIQAGLQGEIPETPKPDEKSKQYLEPLVIGSNKVSLNAAGIAAQQAGLTSIVLSDHLIGEAREMGVWIVNQVHDYFTQHPEAKGKYCFLCGGETTVTIKGQGKGGRNTEMALSSVPFLARFGNACLVTLATDGEDGPTDAAGAWCDQLTLKKANGMGLDVNRYLDQNDSYHYFQQLDQLLITGSTGTNVNDICFVIVQKE